MDDWFQPWLTFVKINILLFFIKKAYFELPKHYIYSLQEKVGYIILLVPPA